MTSVTADYQKGSNADFDALFVDDICDEYMCDEGKVCLATVEQSKTNYYLALLYNEDEAQTHVDSLLQNGHYGDWWYDIPNLVIIDCQV